MPLYEYFCETCQKDVTVSMTISQHDTRSVTCPQCGGAQLRPLVSTIFTQTSRKS